MAEHPWAENEHGLWCPVCGNLIEAAWNIDDDFEPPEICNQCGYDGEPDA